MENKKLWDSALAEIELNVSKANFNTWFKNTFISKQDQGVIYLSVPNTFVRDWLVTKHHKLILKAIRNILTDVRSIEYVITKLEDKLKQKGDDSHNHPTLTPAANEQLGLNDLFINRENNLNPKYTFENFIIGPFNEVAYAAAQAVIKNPGMSYNPLYIYGSTGLVKLT